MNDLGLETRYLDAEQYEALWTEQETTVKELLPAVRQEGPDDRHVSAPGRQ